MPVYWYRRQIISGKVGGILIRTNYLRCGRASRLFAASDRAADLKSRKIPELLQMLGSRNWTKRNNSVGTFVPKAEFYPQGCLCARDRTPAQRDDSMLASFRCAQTSLACNVQQREAKPPSLPAIPRYRVLPSCLCEGVEEGEREIAAVPKNTNNLWTPEEDKLVKSMTLCARPNRRVLICGRT